MSKKTQKRHPKQQAGRSSIRRPAEISGGAEETDPPSPAAAPISETAEIADKKNKSSLLRGLFGFLNKNSDNEAEDGQEEAAATRWTPQEKLMLANIGELHAARVSDIMIPRAEIEALDLAGTNLAEALRRFEQSGRSRMPVYQETLDDPRGMIHIRDLLAYVSRIILAEADKADKANNKTNTAAALRLSAPIGSLGLVRNVLFVPDSMPAGRLLARMQAGRIQMALVIDEHGGTDGLVSMEDIVELIVGDIEDEHDEDSDDIVKEAQNSWVLDAAAELEELKTRAGLDFADNALAEDVDTIGGLIVSALNRIPVRGEKIEIFPHYVFQILDADRRRIKRIRLTRLEQPHDS